LGAIYTAKYAKYSPKTLRIKICNANKGARNAQIAFAMLKKQASSLKKVLAMPIKAFAIL
jgi:hypothetical protein